jgi:hypothetical protein
LLQQRHRLRSESVQVARSPRGIEQNVKSQ